jgi:hypothetical protein
MRTRLKVLDQIYDRDLKTDAYVINVVVNKYEDIFNNLDPSPFKRRDLNSNLISFLEDCSSDIPLKQRTVIQFQVPKSGRRQDLEDLITTGLRTYFSFIMNSYSRRIKMINERNMVFVGISFLLLLAASFMTRLKVDNLFFTTLNEGIFIGGWVFMWEAISSNSIEKREIKNRYRQYKRFFDSPIEFKSYDVPGDDSPPKSLNRDFR